MSEFTPAAFPNAPLRQDDLAFIVDCLRQGACCSIVGPSNLGKSVLLRSLPRDTVRQACVTDDALPPIIVLVNCLEAGASEHTFYELLSRRVMDELRDAGANYETLDSMRAYHQEILRATSDLVARSLFASCLRAFARDHAVSVVIAMDRFQDVFLTLSAFPFRELRAARDEWGLELCYVVATTQRLDALRNDEATHEFRELFYGTTRVIRPLSRDETHLLAHYFYQKQNLVLDNVQETRAIDLSGGHPGLLKHLLRVFNSRAASSELEQLLKDEAIADECTQLFQELEAPEQDALTAFVNTGHLTTHQQHILDAKGLITKNGSSLSLFTPLLAAYIKQRARDSHDASSGGLSIDSTSGQIFVNGREVTLGLSEPQRQLLRLLYQKRGETVTYQEIAEAVWKTNEGVTPGAIYELVKRSRQKIEADWKEPKWIVTVAGEGYRLDSN
jgi:DNA-binding winged helix-turn-helix (wHTH) protein